MVVFGAWSGTHLSKALYCGKEALLYSTQSPSEGSSGSKAVSLVLENRLKDENLRTDTRWTSSLSRVFCLSTCIPGNTH